MKIWCSHSIRKANWTGLKQDFLFQKCQKSCSIAWALMRHTGYKAQLRPLLASDYENTLMIIFFNLGLYLCPFADAQSQVCLFCNVFLSHIHFCHFFPSKGEYIYILIHSLTALIEISLESHDFRGQGTVCQRAWTTWTCQKRFTFGPVNKCFNLRKQLLTPSITLIVPNMWADASGCRKEASVTQGGRGHLCVSKLALKTIDIAENYPFSTPF